MEFGLLILSVLTLVLLLYLLFRKQGSNGLSRELRELIKGEFYQNREEMTKSLRETRLEITQSMERLNEVLAKKFYTHISVAFCEMESFFFWMKISDCNNCADDV